MTDERLEKLWKQVEHIGYVDRFDDDRMLALGSVFGEMRAKIKEQRELLEGNDGMSVKEIRAQFVDMHRDYLNDYSKLKNENEGLHEALKLTLTFEAYEQFKINGINALK